MSPLLIEFQNSLPRKVQHSPKAAQPNAVDPTSPAPQPFSVKSRLPPTMEMRKIALILFLTPFMIAQRVFIDGQPAYKQLPPCAEVPLSGIVRDMRSGCGDGQKTTSYNCFCTASSSKFSSIISTAVASSCAAKNTVDPVSAASSALDVFNSYCHGVLFDFSGAIVV